MFYKNFLKPKRQSLQRLSVGSFRNGINAEAEESLMPINMATSCYNFSFKNGALTSGMGVDLITLRNTPFNQTSIKRLQSPPEFFVRAAWMYNYYHNFFGLHENRLIVLANDFRLYYNTVNRHDGLNDWIEVLNFRFTSVPQVVNYKLNGEDCIIFTSVTDGMFVWNYSWNAPLHFRDIPPITSMCVHNERVWATVSGSSSEIWFSEDLDPTNWNVSLNEAGFIQLADELGKLNCVITFAGHLYVFREFGITRISAFGDQSTFSVANVFYTGSKIYENTVTVCGDRIMFMANDGVYVFDGLSATRLELAVANKFEPSGHSVGSYHDGKYFLSTRVNYNDNLVIGAERFDNPRVRDNNCLISINTKTGELEMMRGLGIIGFVPVNTELATILGLITKDGLVQRIGMLTQSGALLEERAPKYWCSPHSDFGFARETKVIKEIHVKNQCPIALTVNTENGDYFTFNLDGTKATNKIRCSIKGEMFKIEISSDNHDIHVADLQFTYGVME